jgi:mRNA-degrading endonuclease toxin of MazEF toxin-antitoxin module
MKTGDIWLAQLDPTVGSTLDRARWVNCMGALRRSTLAVTLANLQAVFAP